MKVLLTACCAAGVSARGCAAAALRARGGGGARGGAGRGALARGARHAAHCQLRLHRPLLILVILGQEDSVHVIYLNIKDSLLFRSFLTISCMIMIKPVAVHTCACATTCLAS